MEGIVERLVFAYWLMQFSKYVVIPAGVIAILCAAIADRDARPPRSYITHLGQPVTTEPLYISDADCRKLADVLALSQSAQREFTVACAK